MSTPTYRECRRKLVEYIVNHLGAETPMPMELDEIERLALDLAKAAEDARLVQHGTMTDRHRLERMEAAGLGVVTVLDDGMRTGWTAHTERTGWWVAEGTLRQTIDKALEALKEGE